MANKKSRTQRIADISKAVESAKESNLSQLKRELLDKIESMLAELKMRPIPAISEYEPDEFLDNVEKEVGRAGFGDGPAEGENADNGGSAVGGDDALANGGGGLGDSGEDGSVPDSSMGGASNAGPKRTNNNQTDPNKSKDKPQVGEKDEKKNTNQTDPNKSKDKPQAGENGDKKNSKQSDDTGTGKNRSVSSGSDSKSSSGPKPKTDSASAGAGTTASSGAGGAVGNSSRLAALKDVVGEDGKIDKEKALDLAKQEGLKKLWAIPHVRIAILIIVAVVLIIVMIFGFWALAGENKVVSSFGGSVRLSLEKGEEESEALVARMKELVQPAEGEPIVEVVAPADPKDLTEWQNEEGRMTHKMDRRVLQTIDYLVDQGWEKIVIGLLKTGGPDKTSISRQNDKGEVEQIVSTSAYSLGQAMGIVALGKTSPGLTSCLGLGEPIPVQISWQEVTADNVTRPIHEQLQVDMHRLELLLGGSSGARAFDPEEPYVFSKEEQDLLEKIRLNISAMSQLLVASNGNPRALEYLSGVSGNFEVKDGDLAKDVVVRLESGMTRVFRALQVANVVGWEGSRPNGCRLWKAYEARANIRKLALQVLQMPVRTAQGELVFNRDLLVKQLIVFSPEDDIDNGMSNLDVFPSGAVAIDVGGVSFDTTNKDNKITREDWHFVSLPVDNSIFAKKSTVFLREVDGQLYPMENLPGLSSSTSVEKPEQELETLWDGQQESLGRVSYKNFVHIGF